MFDISFSYNNENINFESDGVLSLYNDILDWLDKNGYNFEGSIHDAFVRKVYNESELNQLLDSKKYLKRNMFYNINNSGKYIQITEGNIGNRLRYMLDMLSNFGIDINTIKTKGFESGSRFSSRIKKFGEIDDVEIDELDKPIEIEIEKTEPIEKLKLFKKNPFRQVICVLGEPGAGKSVTVRKILRKEGYKFQIWEPTAATSGLLSQFSPSKSDYIPNRVGIMMADASKDPDNLYTFVLDEIHKSNIIEMINDELKHAISLKRYEGDRFIPYEDSTSYLAEYLKEDDGGNLEVPDNFGFIFLSSKPKVIANNGDIFDRLDIVMLKHHEEEEIKSVSELISKVLGPDEKKKLKSTRND